MRERSKRDEPQPLPRSWLPDAGPPDDSPVWAERIERIMAASAPELERMTHAPAAAEATPWSVMGQWWKPAAVLAAASLMLLLASDGAADAPDSPTGSILLGIVASDGDPATLWRSLGIEADPALALIALRYEAGASDAPVSPPLRKDEDS